MICSGLGCYFSRLKRLYSGVSVIKVTLNFSSRTPRLGSRDFGAYLLEAERKCLLKVRPSVIGGSKATFGRRPGKSCLSEMTICMLDGLHLCSNPKGTRKSATHEADSSTAPGDKIHGAQAAAAGQLRRCASHGSNMVQSSRRESRPCPMRAGNTNARGLTTARPRYKNDPPFLQY